MERELEKVKVEERSMRHEVEKLYWEIEQTELGPD